MRRVSLFAQCFSILPLYTMLSLLKAQAAESARLSLGEQIRGWTYSLVHVDGVFASDDIGDGGPGLLGALFGLCLLVVHHLDGLRKISVSKLLVPGKGSSLGTLRKTTEA